jgi:protein-S-isoprenylcysteine O-methyltransferase Ste14
MSLTFKNLLLNLFYYAVTVVVFPWVILRLERSSGPLWQGFAAIRIASVLLGLAGVALQAWCIVLLQVSGGGTPSPAVNTKSLVTSGPYRRVRNPINAGELMVFIALSGWFASPLLLTYALTAALVFHGFIVFWEERWLLDRFGSEYVQYRLTVNRWIPRMKFIQKR